LSEGEMNVKSLVFDYGLPGLVVLATGIATYMITGGPEEFPSAEDEPPQGEGASEDGLEGDEIAEESSEQAMLASNLPPAWATEVR
jgi:hypothetical protein